MSLPRFFSRINDAISPLLSSGADLKVFLNQKIVCLEAPSDIEANPLHLAGFVLATNLCARLYPKLSIIASKGVVEQCSALVLQINPGCEIQTVPGPYDAKLAWGMRDRDLKAVSVSPAGWNVVVDGAEEVNLRPTNILTSLAAGAVGTGEIFRTVFAEILSTGRTGPQPGRFNLLTLDDSPRELPIFPNSIDLGRVHLVGAGAVGQAFVYTLARLPATGTLVVLDPERTTLSNLQRYVLTTDADIDIPKVTLVRKALSRSSIHVSSLETTWGDSPHNPEEVEVACTAVDTEAVRIAIQASLPHRIYNAWTQPADFGWSRHESFGEEPCLACLYWPTRSRPHLHELIAGALRQHELRVLTYLSLKLPVDVPVRPEQIPQLQILPVPMEAPSWGERSILEDIALEFQLEPSQVEDWKTKQLSELYRDGVCAGAILGLNNPEVSQEMAVPLAHQSALAGIMLASQVIIASSEELTAYRPTVTEGRLNVLSGLPQIALRPRQRTAGCICADSDFLDRYHLKWR